MVRHQYEEFEDRLYLRTQSVYYSDKQVNNCSVEDIKGLLRY
uniref:Uncharacterized protein n=1 Tax=Bartonella rochalimae ATCC BAA-1498 TaxID=685782 RepID=E6YMH7_9HYPH|nr:conserved hypothetical protein [Bartonella rochalimae ATCC BAA-1498]